MEGLMFMGWGQGHALGCDSVGSLCWPSPEWCVLASMGTTEWTVEEGAHPWHKH